MTTAKRPPLDLKRLRELIRPADVLRARGWRPVGRQHGQLHGPCPFHGSTHPRSSTLSVGAISVYCHKCRWRGDAVDIWAWMLRCSILDAAYELCEAHGIEPPILER